MNNSKVSMRPNYGNVVSLDNKSLVKIDEDTKGNFQYTGTTVTMGDGVRCATFTNDKGEVFAQPWALAGMYRRKGEANLGSRLKNQQVRDMVKKFIIDKVSAKDLSVEYEISESHCEAMVTGNSWRHITVGLIHQLKNGNVAPVKVAVNKTRGRMKLSPTVIPFIIKDKVQMKLSTKDLAKKYCVSQRQIQRILSGKAWK